MTSSLTVAAEKTADFKYWHIGARWDDKARVAQSTPTRKPITASIQRDPSPKDWQPVAEVPEGDD